jgi:multimeric flavodoxin WrbA
MSCPDEQRRLVFLWWSNTGGTRALIDAACEGAQDAAADAPRRVCVDAVRCDRVSPKLLLAADALVLASPECLGSVAGPMKTMLDRCYYPVLGQTEGRAWSALVCAGSDGDGALRLLRRVAAGWRMREVVPALKVISPQQCPSDILAPTRVATEDLARASEFGATLSAGLGLGLW